MNTLMNTQMPEGWTLMHSKRADAYAVKSPGGVIFTGLGNRSLGGTKQQAIDFAHEQVRLQAIARHEDDQWKEV